MRCTQPGSHEVLGLATGGTLGCVELNGPTGRNRWMKDDL